MTTGPATNSVLLIHGTCIKPMAWEKWVDRYSVRGYHVIASEVPMERGHEKCIMWRENPRERAAAVAVTDYYDRIARSMAAPPILVGHCFGGLVVQFLIDRGLGAAGVAINSPQAPERHAVAAAVPAAVEPAIDYGSPHRAPLLLVAGGRDRHVPAELVARVALRYQESDAATGFLEYPQGCHHALRAPGWEQLADDVLDWAELYARPGLPIGINPEP